jgi:hypothetical protein
MFWPVYDAQNLGAQHICTTATQQAGFESGTFQLLGGLASGVVAQYSVPGGLASGVAQYGVPGGLAPGVAQYTIVCQLG